MVNNKVIAKIVRGKPSVLKLAVTRYRDLVFPECKQFCSFVRSKS